MSIIEETIAKRLLDRAAVGKAKYGTDMTRDDLQFVDWLTHLQEELMDSCVYIEKLIQDFKNWKTSNTKLV